MSKEKRLQVYNKYDGRCAYCGCELPERWHVDHIISKYKFTLKSKDERKNILENIDNLNPACPSCNINKRERNPEQFREFIYDMLKSLQFRNVNYQVCEKYGLIQETKKEIIFYFERSKEK